MINEIDYQEVKERLREDLYEDFKDRICRVNDDHDNWTLEKIKSHVEDITHIWKSFSQLNARIESCEKMVTSYSVGIQNVYNEFKRLETEHADFFRVVQNRKILNRLQELKEIFSA